MQVGVQYVVYHTAILHIINIPIINSFLSFGKIFISISEVKIPSRDPKAESIPNVSNIRKKSMAKNVDPGSRFMESVSTTKARPEPPDV